jgi:Na+-transporting NADH:ubiquinone oxidoreductase subunit NqrD
MEEATETKSQGTFVIRSVYKMRQILKAFWFKELIISGRLSVFVYFDSDNTIVKPDAEHMCCKLFSYIIYLQYNVNRYFYVHIEHIE